MWNHPCVNASKETVLHRTVPRYRVNGKPIRTYAEQFHTLKCLIAGGVGISGGVGILWKIQLTGGSELAGGVGIAWKLQLMGVRLSGGGLDLCNHVNKCILKSTLSWFAFSIYGANFLSNYSFNISV